MIMFMWWNTRVWCKVYAPDQFADRAWDFMIMSGWTFPSPGGRWATLYNYLLPDTKDPGFVRFRNRHDRTWNGCEKYLKTEQTEHSQCHLQNGFYFRYHFLILHFFSQCKKNIAVSRYLDYCNFLVFKYFLIKILLRSGLLLKRTNPGSIVYILENKGVPHRSGFFEEIKS